MITESKTHLKCISEILFDELGLVRMFGLPSVYKTATLRENRMLHETELSTRHLGTNSDIPP